MFYVTSGQKNQNAIQSSNSTFTGKFLLKGERGAVENLYRIIKNENKQINILTDYFTTPQGSRFVLTADDVELKSILKKSKFAEGKANYTIRAEDILDKTKTHIKKLVTTFFPQHGIYAKNFQIKTDGVTFISSIQNEVFQSKELMRTCKFDKKLSLSEAIEKIGNLRWKQYDFNDKKYSFHINAISDTKSCAETVAADKKLAKLKTNKLIGAGSNSMIFDIGNNKAFRISDKPCYPEALENFDLPIIDSGKIKLSGLYWCITPKAKNFMQTRISGSELNELIKEIHYKGYRTAKDLHPEAITQVVKWKNKLYLADYECAFTKDWKSRIFGYYDKPAA